jgi:DMSO/TMAO reductase YedYZ molybdopterin-dependent catalytic subunit
MANDPMLLSRRRLLRGAIAATGAGLLAGCDALSRDKRFVRMLELAEPLSMQAQRLLTGKRLATEFPESMVSPVFRPNGSTNPRTPEYRALVAGDFAGYRLRIRGRVQSPLEFALDGLRGLPQRTQVTRHDCVEGWSVIGKWQGVPLAYLLDLAKPLPGARYVVFHCFDDIAANGSRYYESIDLEDAYHPQTIAAHRLNEAPLPIANGAPVRMRIERKLGYKHAKYVHTIEVVDSFASIGRGRGGFWEDRNYDWYAGI